MTEPNEAARAIALLDYHAHMTEAVDRTRHQITLAASSIQALMLLNGGALTLLIVLAACRGSLHVSALYYWASFAGCAVGTALALITNLGAFLSQGFYYQVAQFQAWNAQRGIHGLEPTRVADITVAFSRGCRAIAIGLATGLLALIGFIIGCGFALASFLPA